MTFFFFLFHYLSSYFIRQDSRRGYGDVERAFHIISGISEAAILQIWAAMNQYNCAYFL